MASRLRLLLNGRARMVLVDRQGDRLVLRVDDGAPVAVEIGSASVPGFVSLAIDGRAVNAYVSRRGTGVEVTLDGRRFEVAPAVMRRARGPVGGLEDPLGRVTAPLPGVVVQVRIAVGDHVAVGQVLLVVEAMKMQHEVQAPHAGTVTALHCAEGARVERDALLVEYEPDFVPLPHPEPDLGTTL